MSAANNHGHLKNKGENPYRFPAPPPKISYLKDGPLKIAIQRGNMVITKTSKWT